VLKLTNQNHSFWSIVLAMGMLLLVAANQQGCGKTSPAPEAIPTVKPSEANTNSTAWEKSDNVTAPDSSHRIMVYYFHRTVRCPGCLEIESMAQQVIDQNFVEEQQDGRVVWLALNIDDPENQDFVKDYDLEASTLVIADSRTNVKERWKKLDKVWELRGNPEVFNQYIREEVAAYLAGEKQ